MPTRTERLQATTSLEKLSKYNRYRQKLSHTELNEILALFPQITAVDSRTTIATKVEYLSAANFLVYHGKKLERLEALSDAELQTLNIMFKYPPTADRAEILSRITEFADSQEDHNDPLSEDSSGIVQDQLRPREEQVDTQSSTNPAKARKNKARTSSRMKKKSPSRMTAKNAVRNVHADENLAGRGSATTVQEQAIRPPSPAHIQGGKSIYALIIDGDGVDFARNQ